MKYTAFTVAENKEIYKGYAEDGYWNGWAKPWFDKDKSMLIMAEYNKSCDEWPMVYNEDADAFIANSPYDEPEVYKGSDINIGNTTLHLYPIGNSCWIWDNISDYQSREAKVVWDYMQSEYGYISNPKDLAYVYYGIVGDIDGYMSDTELQLYVDAFIRGYEVDNSKEEQ